MNLQVFTKSLDSKEKFELFQILEAEILMLPQNKDKTNIVETYTRIEVFCEEIPMTTRLKNILLYQKDRIGMYLELINPMDISKSRNAGKNTVNEFIELRLKYKNERAFK